MGVNLERFAGVCNARYVMWRKGFFVFVCVCVFGGGEVVCCGMGEKGSCGCGSVRMESGRVGERLCFYEKVNIGGGGGGCMLLLGGRGINFSLGRNVSRINE